MIKIDHLNVVASVSGRLYNPQDADWNKTPFIAFIFARMHESYYIVILRAQEVD